jgi:hypothetical protein
MMLVKIKLNRYNTTQGICAKFRTDTLMFLKPAGGLAGAICVDKCKVSVNANNLV